MSSSSEKVELFKSITIGLIIVVVAIMIYEKYNNNNVVKEDFLVSPDDFYQRDCDSCEQVPDDETPPPLPKVARNKLRDSGNSAKCVKIYKDSNKTKIRDFDDGMVESVYAPIQDIECDYFGEKDMYKESVFRYKDTDSVDRINMYRSDDNNNLLNKSIANIHDDLNRSNDVKKQNNLLLREGVKMMPANRSNVTYKQDRWHYERENSMNGGAIYGFNGLTGFDQNTDLGSMSSAII